MTISTFSSHSRLTNSNGHLNTVTKCLKAGIEESFLRQRIEKIASVAKQRLDELIATTIVVARKRKNPIV
jgi:hypothetical protein